MVPTERDLEEAIFDATKIALSKLLSDHSGESFYYIALITSGEALRPFLSAWSLEALADSSENEVDAAEIKWSYADSPYCAFADECFEYVEKLFDQRPAINDKEYDLRLRAMESALKKLDSTGVFGEGNSREGLYINVECMPPDHTNTERAHRLNPEKSLISWLEEAAE